MKIEKIDRPPSKQPIPPDAKRVFEGVIFEIYQWQQKLFDGSSRIFEKARRADTVVVIAVTSDKKIILTRQEQPGKPPFLGCAGGRVETGEDPLAAARRELLEETGYEAGELSLWHAVQPLSKIDWAVYTFIAKDCRRVAAQQLDGGEKIELELVDFDKFVQVATNDNSFLEMETVMEILRAAMDPAKMADIKMLFGVED